MVGKTALNKEMKHLNGAYFRTINSNMNMTKIELNPLKGIHIAQVGTIEFGMTANEVKEILGQPEQEDDSQLYYCSEELRLDFNSKNVWSLLKLYQVHIQKP